MSETLQAVPPARTAGHYRIGNVARAEIAKVLSLRSTIITLGLTLAASLLVTGLVTGSERNHPAGYYFSFDPTSSSLSGMIVAGLTGGVFGALLIASEYSSGTIRTTLAATPKRPLLLVAKMAVTAALMVVFCEVLSFLSFFLGQAVLSGGAPTANLGSPGALRAVLMTGVFIALLALMSFGFGLIFRNTAAAIAAFVGVVFVLPLVVHQISEHADRFVPTNLLTNSVMATVHTGGPDTPLSAAVGLLLMALYAAIVLAVGAMLFIRRDAVSRTGDRDDWMPIRLSDQPTEEARRLVLLVLREPFQKRSWTELGFFLLSSVLAFATAFVLGALGFAGLVLTIVFLGVLILAGGLRTARGLGRWQRALAQRVLGEEIPEPEPFRPRPGLWGWVKAAMSDRAAWRAVVYFIAKLPLSIFGIWFSLSVWIEALSGVLSPLLGAGGFRGFGLLGRLSGATTGPGQTTFGTHVVVFLSGVVFLFVAPWTMRVVVYFDRRLMHFLLGPDAATSRVRSLEESRSKTLDAATETLQRIERDLHDGTQAQLVALAMRLGQAKDKLDNLGHLNDLDGGSGETTDLDAIRRLVDEAHRGAKEAITDLRDLARGIHPPALDTGLENALATLAARSPVPTAATITVQSRPSPAIEAICYFCAAELLANVAQHAQASRTSLSCAQHGPWLRLVVHDDGQGGAAVNRIGSSSSGLAGLADRVAAVDGYLSIASPPGGPTAITVDLPLHA